jgi:hypothetical protein
MASTPRFTRESDGLDLEEDALRRMLMNDTWKLSSPRKKQDFYSKGERFHVCR